ncbi:hypothetical protein G7068_09970 [Leucobacter viscericola]|uniref:Uncharacterized protein n=1 Tax=Leucobacter viscericola TaxID=2714935 RepID=A0A6G7XGB9_9MICO|nr:hypothetical protein [Leucobacter viscericola]QIK63489.1 hypothetical protein G7068_09970 [Leucobacter viscericola]
MSRREKTSIGFSPLMVIAVLVALALAISFPFALVNTMPKQQTPLERAKQSLESSSPAAGDALDLNSLRVLETDPNGTTFLAARTSSGASRGSSITTAGRSLAAYRRRTATTWGSRVTDQTTRVTFTSKPHPRANSGFATVRDRRWA